MRNTVLLSALVLVSSAAPAEALYEDFSGGVNTQRWIISNWSAPRNGPSNHASFSARHVTVRNGALVLKLTQKKNADGSITSTGAEIKTVAKLGYGIYEFELRSSSTAPDPKATGSTVSGSITGVGPFLDLSETEIDVEMEGLPARSDLTQTSTWIHEARPHETSKIPPEKGQDLPYQSFHLYRFVWLPGSVTFYRDGKLIAVHTKVVPARPAQFIFNHWGTNGADWGGVATPIVERYVYVKYFRYTST